MAAKKTAAAKNTPAAYLAALPEAVRGEVKRLDAIIREAAPKLSPYVAGSMLGYGRYRYRYESGREGESCKIGLAARASGISVYVCAADEKGYLAEREAPKLGKVSVGKSCIRFKKVDDLDLRVFAALLKKAARTPAPGEITPSS